MRQLRQPQGALGTRYTVLHRAGPDDPADASSVVSCGIEPSQMALLLSNREYAGMTPLE